TRCVARAAGSRASSRKCPAPDLIRGCRLFGQDHAPESTRREHDAILLDRIVLSSSGRPFLTSVGSRGMRALTCARVLQWTPVVTVRAASSRPPRAPDNP